MASSLKKYFVKFCQLDSYQLMACLQLRQDVFMIEQNSLYRDLDGFDEVSWHYILQEKEKTIAYARLIPPQAYENVAEADVHLGRLVVAKEYRGTGLARKIMEDLIEQSCSLFPNRRIAISAQAHLTGFYESLGFVCEGELYDDGGVDHIDMIKTTAC